jgi:ATP-dependent helicase/nuclease subunit B
MILGGLNEDSWPPKADPSPWMSRPMMKTFGLPLPERRIGLSAHDFAQAFCARTVYLTRARREEGTPTVSCRWLLRLDLFTAGTPWQTGNAEAAGRWLAWQRALDAPAAEDEVTIAPPAPRPPVAVRPRRLSVTQIETWMRDPYAIYARHILGLRALDPLDADPTAAEYGAAVHRALDAFVRAFPAALPDGAYDYLLSLGRDAFAALLDRPGVRAFWWPRFRRIGAWFLDGERARRAQIARSWTEVTGSMVLAAPAGPFTLTAKADRIDQMADGTLAIIDYKTGSVPKAKEVAAGFAPQLPLEAAIARVGGFIDVPARPVSALAYWQLTGAEPAGKREPLADPDAELIESAVSGLETLIEAFDRPETAYLAQPRPAAAPRFSDYAHLARVREWSAVGDGGD